MSHPDVKEGNEGGFLQEADEILRVARERIRIEVPSIASEEALFRQHIIGQDRAVASFARALAITRSGIRLDPKKPLASFFLTGPSGVGKTSMAYALADILAGSENTPKIVKVNCAEFSHGHNISRLIGSPPGYVGKEVVPVLSQANLAKNAITYTDMQGQTRHITILLFDEAEKADKELDQILLSALDRGEANLANNQPVDFSNTIIIFVSNTGNGQVEDMRRGSLGELSFETTQQVFKETYEKSYSPEFRGRIGEFIVFDHLSPEAVEQIATMQIKNVEEGFIRAGVQIGLNLSRLALDWIVARGYSKAAGARALEKAIKDYIGDPLTLSHAKNSLDGNQIYVDTEAGKLIFYSSPLQKQSKLAVDPGPQETTLSRSAEGEPNLDGQSNERPLIWKVRRFMDELFSSQSILKVPGFGTNQEVRITASPAYVWLTSCGEALRDHRRRDLVADRDYLYACYLFATSTNEIRLMHLPVSAISDSEHFILESEIEAQEVPYLQSRIRRNSLSYTFSDLSLGLFWKLRKLLEDHDFQHVSLSLPLKSGWDSQDKALTIIGSGSQKPLPDYFKLREDDAPATKVPKMTPPLSGYNHDAVIERILAANGYESI